MILVTGGLGFIGSHIVLQLLSHGHEVVIVDNLSNASSQILERLEYISGMYIPFVKLDIRNTPALNKVFEQYPVQAVVHAAGFKSLDESVLKPLDYYNDNVSCIMSLLRSMQRMGVRQLVCLSSLAVYGTSSRSLDEETALNYSYANPYVKSLQMMENIIQDTIAVDHDWNVAILRVANVGGGFQHGALGEYVKAMPRNILPLAYQVAIGQREYIELRENSTTNDQSSERSFIHVLDVTSAIYKTLQWLNNQTSVLEIFDIAGPVLSMKQLLEHVENVTGQSIPTQASDFFDFEELAQIGSQSVKAQEILNWKIHFSHEDLIKDGWLFYQNLINHT